MAALTTPRNSASNLPTLLNSTPSGTTQVATSIRPSIPLWRRAGPSLTTRPSNLPRHSENQQNDSYADPAEWGRTPQEQPQNTLNRYERGYHTINHRRQPRLNPAFRSCGLQILKVRTTATRRIRRSIIRRWRLPATRYGRRTLTPKGAPLVNGNTRH